MDYESIRSDFYMRNRPRDYYMNYYEKRFIPGLTKYNLVNINNTEPCFVNICFKTVEKFIIFKRNEVFLKCGVHKRSGT